MNDLLQHIQSGLIIEHAKVIAEADSNSDKWFELFVVYNNGSTESVAGGDTFTECFAHVGNYFEEYRFDRMNIDVWYDRDEPKNGQGFFSPSVLYRLIQEYLTKTGFIQEMAFYGSFRFNDIDKQYYFTPDYTANGYIFKDEITFTYFHDLICYISENEFEDAGGDCHTGSSYTDILSICQGDKNYARKIFDNVDWQHPSTLWEDWNSNEVLEERSDKQMLKGEEAKKMLQHLLSGNGSTFVYQIVRDYAEYCCSGIFLEGELFTAFDNRSGNCNVEEFELEEDALKWLNHDYDEASEFKGYTSAY